MDNIDKKMLLFRLSKEYYAANISDIERILEYTQVVPIPDFPSFIEGVVNYEEMVIPIVNLCEKFNLQKYKYNGNDDNSKIIVVRREKRKFGVVVDDVCQVYDICKDMIQDVPLIALSEANNYVKELAKIDRRIVILLDMEKILSKEDSDKIF